MQYLKILSVPVLKFAHVFGVEKYSNTLYARENFIEISFVTKGTLKKEYEYTEQLSRQGDISCNTYDGVTKVRADTFHEHHTVGFEVLFERAESPLAGFLTIPKNIPYSDHTINARRLIDKIIELSKNHDTPPVLLSGLILELLGEIDLTAKKPQKGITYSNRFYTDKAKEYISANLKKPITQRSIAEYLGVTPQYLCTVFKATTGESIIKYVNKLKLQQIQILIERENVKLHQAALIMGYADPNYVSRLYKKYYGRNVTFAKRND